jgi:hypothetical protein
MKSVITQWGNLPAFMATFAGETLWTWEVASWTRFFKAVTQILLQSHNHTLFIIQVCLLPPVVNAILALVHYEGWRTAFSFKD